MASASFQDKSIPGGVVHNPASAYAREMAKWESGYSAYGPPGRQPQPRQDFPKAMYLMKRSETNGDFVTVAFAEAADDAAERNLRSRGFHFGQVEAIKAIEDGEKALAVGAAERAHQDRWMGDRARAEAQAADAATGAHLAEVPVTPIRKRGRPAKSQELSS